MEVFGVISTWFGYVGACMVAPDATCRPLLAFIALGAAASASLTLVLLAYSRAQQRELAEIEEQRARVRNAEAQDRVRRAVADRAAVKPALRGGVHAAA